jgi:predicted cupin superfamily sugar epimerase
MKSANFWINHLQLISHPEGGYFKEIYRAAVMHGERNIATSIYFLLKQGDVSHLHRLTADELWYYHQGDALKVTVIDKEGKLTEHLVGPNPDKGETLQLIIPAGSIFGSEPTGQYALVGCMVSPGFDFKDFELFTTSQLMEMYPQHEENVQRLSKNKYSF